MKTIPLSRLAWLFAVSLAVPSLASGQHATGASCGGQSPVGYLGISGIACNCTITRPNGGEWKFRTEPAVTSLEMDSRAGAVLKIGDVITHVNGKLITTADGAAEFANIDPGEAVVLTVRRKGQSLRFALTAEAACPNDTRLLGHYAPGRPGSPAPAARPHIAEAPETPTPERAAVGAARAPVARVTFGMGLSCTGKCRIGYSDKTGAAEMSFTNPPEVYSIEKGGPADRAGVRRGDVLTHVNGVALDTEAGGRLFANAKPGESLRFTIRRGSERKTISVRAAARSTPMPSLAQSSEALDRARESVSELQREQNALVRKLQEAIRRSPSADEAQLKELHREIMRLESERNEKLESVATALERAELRVNAAKGSASACWTPQPAPTPAASLSRTLRYSANFGDAEIEVRGSHPVSVTESRNEVEITAGGTVVRVRKTNN